MLIDQEQLRLENENVFDEVEKVDNILNIMDADPELLHINNDDINEDVRELDVTAPPSGTSFVSRSSTFPV